MWEGKRELAAATVRKATEVYEVRSEALARLCKELEEPHDDAAFAEASEERGEEFMAKRQYDLASGCYTKALDALGELAASAHPLKPMRLRILRRRAECAQQLQERCRGSHVAGSVGSQGCSAMRYSVACRCGWSAVIFAGVSCSCAPNGPSSHWGSVPYFGRSWVHSKPESCSTSGRFFGWPSVGLLGCVCVWMRAIAASNNTSTPHTWHANQRKLICERLKVAWCAMRPS